MMHGTTNIKNWEGYCCNAKETKKIMLEKR
jgi:hypothetical protein